MLSMKKLGLMVLAVLALTAVGGTASASASKFVTEKTATVVANYPFENESYLEFAGGEKIECYGAPYKGTLAGSASTLPMTWNNGGGYVAPCMNKLKTCQNFTFEPGSASGEHFNGTFNFGPAGCGPIEGSIYFKPAFQTCEIKLFPGTGTRTAEYYNQGSGTKAYVWVPLQINNLEVSLSGCLAKGTYHVNWRSQYKLTATNEGGVAVPLRVE